MPKLDSLVLENFKQPIFTPDRLTSILVALSERRSLQDQVVSDRKEGLDASLARVQDKLARPCKAIEDGILEPDQNLKSRVAALKNEKALIDATIDRLTATRRAQAQISPEKLDAFASKMRTKLDTGDAQARKAYLRSVISRIEVNDQKVRITGDKATLADMIAGRQTLAGNVRGFIGNWRTRHDSNV